jgi:hypothetical protein
VLVVLLVGLVLACTDVVVVPTAPTAPTPTLPPPAAADVVEFRVVGDLPFAIVRVTNSLDGLSQSSSVLPYTSTLSIAAGRESVFLSVDARGPSPAVFGFLHAAIFVNGLLFREASSVRLDPIASVSGTWRR